MKPNEDYCFNPYAENADYEISPLELVQDVSVLILEGRLPEFSSNGRCEGNHCWPVSLDSKKQCCHNNKNDKTSMCNFVQSARRKMRSIWAESIPAFIEVLVCLDNLFPVGSSKIEPCEVHLDYLPHNESEKILLLERWKMDVHLKESHSSSSFVNINMFLQAVRSFLHFSQLSAWLIKTGGQIPSRIFYRIIHGEAEGGLEFRSSPEIHIFPEALTSRTESIRLTLFSLPRLELDTLISMSPYKEYSITKHLSKKRVKKPRNEGSSFKKTFYSNYSDSEETPSSCFDKCSSIEMRHYDVIYIAQPPIQAKLKAVKALHDDVSYSLRKKLVFDTPEKQSIDDSQSDSYDANSWKFIGRNKQKPLLLRSDESLEQRNICFAKKENLNFDLEGSELNGSKSNGSEQNGNESKKSESNGSYDKDGNSIVSSEYRKTFVIGDDDDAAAAAAVAVDSQDVRSCNGSHCNGFGKSYCNGFAKANNENKPEQRPNRSTSLSPDSNNKFYEFEIKSSQNTSESEEINASPEVNSLLKKNLHEATNGSGESLSNYSVCENDKNPSSTDHEHSHYPEVTYQSTNNERSQSCKSLAKLDKSTCEKLRRSESYCGARPRPVSLAAKLSLGASTVPIFHPKTGLPVASSPAPTRKPDVTKTPEMQNGLSPSVAIGKTRKLSSEWIPQSKTLSRSAPASTRLLGNFEESVLKGRMPVFGTVQGFSAEIGASGSFCPPHITCPVKAHFFRTSDDNAPSPYLGHIALRNAKGKKGYHVPRKGTVQVTLFNPNNTVVKVFIVLYDFSDMPSNSHTFLRQKIVSVKKDAVELQEQQTLHYLVHLRFASTKHDRIYLHTDIRLIFPQQSPDVTSSRLKILTNGPLEPKYTPRDR